MPKALLTSRSECVTDDCCFHFDAKNMSPAETDKIRGWIKAIVTELHRRLPKT